MNNKKQGFRLLLAATILMSSCTQQQITTRFQIAAQNPLERSGNPDTSGELKSRSSKPGTGNREPATHNSEPATDTTLAWQYYQKASIFADSTEYDSAISYYQKASRLYKQAAAWEGYVKSCNKIGTNLYKKKNLEGAEKYLQEALTMGLEHLGKEHLHIAKNYYIMGIICSRKSEYDQALDYHKRALEIRLKVRDTIHLDVSISYHGVGMIYYSKGEYDQALEYYKKALDIKLKVLGEEHPDLANNYNSVGVVYHYKGFYNQALEYYKKALDIQLQTLGEKHTDIADYYNNIGIIYSDQGFYDQALEYYKKVLDIRLKALVEEYYVADSYNSIGLIYWIKGYYSHALEYYKKALTIRLKVLDEKHPDVAESYNNIGVVYEVQGFYNQALNYYKKALDINLKVLSEEHLSVAGNYHNLGAIYYSQGIHYKALIYYKKALGIRLKLLGEKHFRVAESYGNIGITYYDNGLYNQAVKYYKKTLDILLEVLAEEHPYVAISYNNIGNVYQQTGNYDQALNYHEKALNIRLKIFGEKHPDIAATYLNIGSIYQDQDDFEKALQYYQKTIMTLVADFGEGIIQQNPKLEKISDEPRLLKTLINKASTLEQLYTKQSRNPEDLHLSVSTYRLAIQLIDKIKRSYKAEKSKLSFADKAHETYQQAIEASLKLYEISREDSLQKVAFTFVEKSKAGLLRELLSESQAKYFAGIPDSLLQQERDLKIDLNYYETAIQKQKLNTEGYDTAQVQDFENRFFDLNRKYESLIEHFEKDYPDYYKLKYELSVADVTEIQEKIPDEQSVLLNYSIGDSSLFIFALTRSDYQVHRVPVDSLFHKRLNELKESLHNEEAAKEVMNNPGNYRRFVENAHWAWQQLLEPALRDHTGIKKLILIPDGSLATLPFDVLLSEKVVPGKTIDYASLPYLFRSYQIRYGYSATLLVRKPPQPAAKQVLEKYAGFAPSYEGSYDTTWNSLSRGPVKKYGDGERLFPLHYNQPEVEGIARNIGGTSFLAAQATEKHFKEQAPKYQVLHLAMHAFSHDAEPMLSGLAFTPGTDSTEDGFLHLSEIYQLPLRADLAVLSACNTGSGKWARGEGVMSLARAFRYAGCPAVVMSLWQADDETTAQLMESFYKHLRSGLPKDEALQQARIDYLKSPQKPHPYFWASFVLIGDEQPVIFKSNSKYWLSISLSVLFVLSALLLYRHRKRLKNTLPT